MKINVEALQEVKQHILEEPRRFFMEGWGFVNGKGYGIDAKDIPSDVSPPCQTSGCIAGHLVMLNNKKYDRDIRSDLFLSYTYGGLILFNKSKNDKLTIEEMKIIENVFYNEKWDSPYNIKYLELSRLFPGLDRRTRIAQLTAEYIDYICEKYAK